MCKALKATNVGHSSIGQFVKDIMSIVGSLRTFSLLYWVAGQLFSSYFGQKSKSFFSFISLDGACSNRRVSTCSFIFFSILIIMLGLDSQTKKQSQ